MMKKCNEVKPHLFGTDGIRGVYGEGLTREMAYRIGRYIGFNVAGKRNHIVIGRDTRFSGSLLLDALVEGIVKSGSNVYDFIWREFCKWYIELSKPILYGEDEAAKAEVRATFAWARDNILKFMHPFMPFITTELWDKTADRKGQELILAPWPKLGAYDEDAMREIDQAIDMIEVITSLRGEVNVPAAAQLKAFVVMDNKATVEHNYESICRQARLASIEILDKPLEENAQKGMIMTYERGLMIYLNVEGIIDAAAEKARLEKTIAELEKNLKGYAAKLSNANFVEKAPAAVVAEERRRQAEALEQKEKAEVGLKRLQHL